MSKNNLTKGIIAQPITGIVNEARYVINGTIGTGRVRLSKKPNNKIRQESDGLYVPPLTWDESEW